MKTKLIIEVDIGEETCDLCRFLETTMPGNVDGKCRIWRRFNSGFRLPACLRSEIKLDPVEESTGEPLRDDERIFAVKMKVRLDEIAKAIGPLVEGRT